MSDLDRSEMPHNTPSSRAALVNVPAWTDGLEFSTHPRVPAEIPGVVADRASAVLYGSVAVGKTGLVACALRDLARAGVGSTFYWNLATSPGVAVALEAGELKRRPPSPVWFESWSRLLSLHRRERWDEEAWFDQLEERVAVLALDDVGVDAGTPYRESFLLRHVEWASGPGRALLLTLNDRPADWPRVLGERVSSRVVDRFAVVRVS